MKKVLCAMMLFAAAILCLHQNVSAAEGATVTVNGDTLQAGSDAWKVTLDISGDTKITNGKIRVTYDSSQLKLVSTEAGSMMNGVLTDINDPVSGNKSEGEAVFVFASSTELDTNGTLFEMTFQVQDSVKDGDSVTVSAKTEELQNNNAAVAVTDVPLNAAWEDRATITETTMAEMILHRTTDETASNNGNNGNGSGSDNQADPVSRPRHLPETAIPPVAAAPSAEHLPEAAVLREPRAEAARLHPQKQEITPMF